METQPLSPSLCPPPPSSLLPSGVFLWEAGLAGRVTVKTSCLTEHCFVLCPVQVHLTDQPSVYGEAPGNTVGERVNKNLFFDLSQSHLYITTEKQVCNPGTLPSHVIFMYLYLYASFIFPALFAPGMVTYRSHRSSRRCCVTCDHIYCGVRTWTRPDFCPWSLSLVPAFGNRTFLFPTSLLFQIIWRLQ